MPSLFQRLASRAMTPPGTTHVLSHIPPSLLDCDHPHRGGLWELWTLRDYRRGQHTAPAGEVDLLDGPGDTDPGDLAAFAENLLGYPVTLTRFDAEISEDDGVTWLAETGYYLRQARW